MSEVLVVSDDLFVSSILIRPLLMQKIEMFCVAGLRQKIDRELIHIMSA